MSSFELRLTGRQFAAPYESLTSSTAHSSKSWTTLSDLWMKERHRCTAHSTAVARSGGPGSGSSRNSHCSSWGRYGRSCRGADARALSLSRFLSSFGAAVWNLRYTPSAPGWRVHQALTQSGRIGSEISFCIGVLSRPSWGPYPLLCLWRSCWGRRRLSGTTPSCHWLWWRLNLLATVMSRMSATG